MHGEALQDCGEMVAIQVQEADHPESAVFGQQIGAAEVKVGGIEAREVHPLPEERTEPSQLLHVCLQGDRWPPTHGQRTNDFSPTRFSRVGRLSRAGSIDVRIEPATRLACSLMSNA